jgi:uncharacterized membrane protein YeiH
MQAPGKKDGRGGRAGAMLLADAHDRGGRRMTVMTLGLWLDLLGTFVFGVSGAMLAVRKRLDIFGVMVLAVAAALAGGMMRDIALNVDPPAALADSRYLLAAIAAGLLVFFAHRWIEAVSKPVMLLDTLGLGLFAVVGCRKALIYGLDPLPAMLLGVLSAVGGGAVRDLLVAQTPRVLREDVYALAALVGAAVVVAGHLLDVPQLWAAVAGIAATVALRLVAARRGWQAPRAPWSDRD